MAKTTGTDFNCSKCGRTIIHAPHALCDGAIMRAKWIVSANIKGENPMDGNLFHIVCKCGKVIIGLVPDWLTSDFFDKGNSKSLGR